MSQGTEATESSTTATIPNAGAPKAKPRAVSPGSQELTSRQRLLIGTVGLVAILSTWEFVTVAFEIRPFFLPRISVVGAALAESWASGDLQGHLWSSINTYFWSMLLALGIAIPMSLVIGAVEKLHRTFTTWIWALYTAPGIVWLPLVLIWAGIGTAAKVTLILISAIPQASVVIIEGVKTVDGSLLRVGRSFGGSRRQILQKIVLPATLPYIGSGVRMGVSGGLIGLIGAELFTAYSGLGFLLLYNAKRYQTAMVFGALFCFLLLCMVAIGASALLERRLSHWRE